MLQLARLNEKEGGESLVCIPDSRVSRINYDDNQYLIENRITRNIHNLLTFITGLEGVFSVISTHKLIRKLKIFKPDVVHLHNIHGGYINFPILFNYIKKKEINVIWTLHDCWSFTGHCPHFTLVKCEKWKRGCYECPQYRKYPETMIDRSKIMWKMKKQWFSNVNNMTLVTPSKWLQNLVGSSFLKSYPVRVINNGIDLSIFRYRDPKRFINKYKIQNKKVILGVAFDWDKRKGLDVFCDLAKRLPSKYQIILVGTNDEIDTKLPCNIISIHRTQNQEELAEIYSAATLFVNPTREENYPTVNMEALACGTPIITFNTGGSPEIISEQTGIVVPVDDLDAIEHAIIKVCEENLFDKKDCIELSKKFDMNLKYREYMSLYREVSGRE